MFEADIQAAIDRQLELERKAAAWDLMVGAAVAENETEAVVSFDELLVSVHTAQKTGP